VEVVEPSRMQATIRRRKWPNPSPRFPEFQVTVEAARRLAVSLRQQMKDSVPGARRYDDRLSVRACALALRKFSRVNSSWSTASSTQACGHIGLAVAPSQGMGLLVPVVHDADIKESSDLDESRQVIDAPGPAGERRRPRGATFSISNPACTASTSSTAIINPPGGGLLAVGAIKDVAVVEDGRTSGQ